MLFLISAFLLTEFTCQSLPVERFRPSWTSSLIFRLDFTFFLFTFEKPVQNKELYIIIPENHYRKKTKYDIDSYMYLMMVTDEVKYLPFLVYTCTIGQILLTRNNYARNRPPPQRNHRLIVVTYRIRLLMKNRRNSIFQKSQLQFSTH